MKKLTLIAIAAAVMMFSSLASAQTANGTLSVTATVTGSINMVFNSDASGVALTGAGTNAATLAFGNVSAYGALPAGVTRPAVGATNFTVASAFDVLVSASNSSSGNYTLTAKLNAADATNTWTISGSGNLNSVQTLTSAGSYGNNNPFSLALTIPFATASGTNISNVVNFTATAN
jgi:hypothetical protein